MSQLTKDQENAVLNQAAYELGKASAWQKVATDLGHPELTRRMLSYLEPDHVELLACLDQAGRRMTGR